MLSNGDLFSLDGEFGSRVCQNIFGDAVLLNGDDVAGDESCLLIEFCKLVSRRHMMSSHKQFTHSRETRRVAA